MISNNKLSDEIRSKIIVDKKEYRKREQQSK